MSLSNSGIPSVWWINTTPKGTFRAETGLQHVNRDGEPDAHRLVVRIRDVDDNVVVDTIAIDTSNYQTVRRQVFAHRLAPSATSRYLREVYPDPNVNDPNTDALDEVIYRTHVTMQAWVEHALEQHPQAHNVTIDRTRGTWCGDGYVFDIENGGIELTDASGEPVELRWADGECDLAPLIMLHERALDTSTYCDHDDHVWCGEIRELLDELDDHIERANGRR